ncbi:hypothetical protein NDR87_35110 [Nocardia sp. CDC159]|uniref:Uncharacterized protein n=1 Tax=Nocardia pulmonis TaxID=2951408 RepID=A0A9X2J1B8_9NOCA|nr:MULTISPECIES: hypothetical protein [Nocardia]MCM6778719.1 hypothetical protein [Nocardia pulmonis]MCM6791608.1 hypothetical protein [Nocardia sp. CDC159]
MPTTIGDIPIRRGYYCVPKKYEGNEVAESTYGYGFGMDKARYRHHITRIKVIDFTLRNSRGTGNPRGNYEFHAWARKKRCDDSGNNCKVIQSQEVIAVASRGEGKDPYDMPTGSPIGLITFYCNYGDPTKLRCESWVNTSLDIFK